MFLIVGRCLGRLENLGGRVEGNSWPSILATVFILASLQVGFSSTTRLGQEAASDVVAIKEGADLDLRCPIEVSSEDMIISWTCDNEPANIRSSRIHVTDMGKLRIRSAKIGDACNYRCEAADGFGTISVIIKVIIVDKRLVDQLSRKNQTNTGPARQVNLNSNPAASPLDTHNIINSSLIMNQQQQDTLDVQIEPSVVEVNRNRTFSLECRVKHPTKHDNNRMPQIIWLKEFIGHEPDSLGDARDKNLIFIDNVYYHSLNWPRSITKSSKSSTTNSALLVRQSSSDHSGRYICFAGYPPYTLASRLTSDSNSNSSREVRYKLATAEVHVSDTEQVHLRGRKQRYLLVGVVTNNTWARNLIIVLTVLCCFLYFAKILYVKWRARRAAVGKNDSTQPMTKEAAQPADGKSLAVPAQLEQQQSLSPLRSVKSTSVPNIKLLSPASSRPALPNSIHLLKQFQPLARIPIQRDLIDCNMIDDDDVSHDEHLYSEISDRFTVTNGNGEHEYYKVPIKRARQMP